MLVVLDNTRNWVPLPPLLEPEATYRLGIGLTCVMDRLHAREYVHRMDVLGLSAHPHLTHDGTIVWTSNGSAVVPNVMHMVLPILRLMRVDLVLNTGYAPVLSKDQELKKAWRAGTLSAEQRRTIGRAGLDPDILPIFKSLNYVPRVNVSWYGVERVE